MGSESFQNWKLNSSQIVLSKMGLLTQVFRKYTSTSPGQTISSGCQLGCYNQSSPAVM